MPKPSVALCSPNPMNSRTARLIWPAAAEVPIANPSAKLCRPIPPAAPQPRPPPPIAPQRRGDVTDGCRAGPAQPRAALAAHESVDPHQPKQPDTDRGSQDHTFGRRVADLMV